MYFCKAAKTVYVSSFNRQLFHFHTGGGTVKGAIIVK